MESGNFLEYRIFRSVTNVSYLIRQLIRRMMVMIISRKVVWTKSTEPNHGCHGNLTHTTAMVVTHTQKKTFA